MTRAPRERLVNSAIALIRERGVHATGLTELLSHSKTARGSIYQHFPGGKTELITTATFAAGQQMITLIESFTATGTPVETIDALIDWWTGILSTSSFKAGCPVVSAALAEVDGQAISDAAATVFTAWEARFAASLLEAGLDDAAATSLGNFIVSALEGAIIQARSAKSTVPLDHARTHLTRLVEHTLAPAISRET